MDFLSIPIAGLGVLPSGGSVTVSERSRLLLPRRYKRHSHRYKGISEQPQQGVNSFDMAVNSSMRTPHSRMLNGTGSTRLPHASSFHQLMYDIDSSNSAFRIDSREDKQINPPSHGSTGVLHGEPYRRI